jgi:hypothetical protein
LRAGRRDLALLGEVQGRFPGAARFVHHRDAGASASRRPFSSSQRPAQVELDALLTEIEQDNRVAVVVFDSADPDFFLAHYDIAADPFAAGRTQHSGLHRGDV